jgi:hypothetical protein
MEGRPERGWPNISQYLDDRMFPSHILTEGMLNSALNPPRLAAIRNAILECSNVQQGNRYITYQTWADHPKIQERSIGLVFTHGVMNYIPNLEMLFQQFDTWLKPGGWMTHHIPFSSMRVTDSWNGHWAYSEGVWKIIAGKMEYPINREPFSTYMNLFRKHGYEVRYLQTEEREDGIPREKLARRWRGLSDQDLHCTTAMVQVRKIR